MLKAIPYCTVWRHHVLLGFSYCTYVGHLGLLFHKAKHVTTILFFVQVAAILLEHSARLDSTTKKGFTPLHLAAKYGNTKVAKLLLAKVDDCHLLSIFFCLSLFFSLSSSPLYLLIISSLVPLLLIFSRLPYYACF